MRHAPLLTQANQLTARASAPDNRLLRELKRIQLRVSVHVRTVQEDGTGMTGQVIIQVSRMLGSPAFSSPAPAVRLGLMVSPFVYDNYVSNGGGVLTCIHLVNGLSCETARTALLHTPMWWPSAQQRAVTRTASTPP
jgi:hypothetical protein